MDLLSQIHQHRSIRRYRPDPVPEALLEEILQASIRTSSAGNMQSYSIVVTADREQKQRLMSAHHNQRMMKEAPVLLTFCADFYRMKHWLRLSQADDSFGNFFGFLVGLLDATLASQSAVLAAESRGLGICYLGSTLSNADEISRILELPDRVIPVAGFTLGYPAEEPPLRDRLPLDSLVHRERYQKYSDETIHQIYQEREVLGWERYMKSSWIRDQVREKDVQNLGQLYTRVKYTPESFQEISARLLDLLEIKGFRHHS